MIIYILCLVGGILCFISGVLFIVLFLPILQQISEVVYVMLESLKSIFTKFVAKNNFEIEQIGSPEEINTNAIGFEIPSSCNDYEDDEEDCEEEKIKNKIGF